MVMVLYSALVRSHQSTLLVASASCVPRGYNRGPGSGFSFYATYRRLSQT